MYLFESMLFDSAQWASRDRIICSSNFPKHDNIAIGRIDQMLVYHAFTLTCLHSKETMLFSMRKFIFLRYLGDFKTRLNIIMSRAGAERDSLMKNDP